MADVDGTCEARFDGVRKALAASLDSGADVGASWPSTSTASPWSTSGAGSDDPDSEPWERDTLTNVWSTTKTMTFVCALMLADRSNWFPRAGRHLLARVRAIRKGGGRGPARHGPHGGLPGWDQPITAEQLADWDLCTSAARRPSSRGGSPGRPGYHAVTQGYRSESSCVGLPAKRSGPGSPRRWPSHWVPTPHRAARERGPAGSNVIPPPPSTSRAWRSTETMIKTFMNPPLDATMAHTPGGVALRYLPRTARATLIGCRGQSVIAGRGHRPACACSPSRAPIRFRSAGRRHRQGARSPTRFGMGYGLSSETMPIGPRACYWGGYGGSRS